MAVLLAALAATPGGPAASARDGIGDTGERKVDASDALRLHALVRRWADGGGVPPVSPAPIEVRDAVGVAVTVRIEGLTVGFGQAVDAEAVRRRADPREPVDLVAMTRVAADQAFDQTVQRLRQAAIRARVEGLGGDPDRPPRLAEAAPRLLLDVQIAHGVEPIDLPADAPADRLYGRFASGDHGLAMIDDAGGAALLWPARAIAMNLPPDRQVTQLLGRLGLPLAAAPRVARPGGPRLARFEALHVVRPTYDFSAVRLVRGNPPTPAFGAVRETIGNLAEALGRHLRGRFTTRGFRGTFEPTPSRYDPELAAPADQLLSAFALLRVEAQTLAELGPHVELSRRVERLLGWVEQVVAAAAGRDDAATFDALALLCLETDPLSIHDPDLAEAIAERLMQRVTRGGDWRISSPDRAVIAAALAARYAERRDPATAEAVLAWVEPIWADGGAVGIHAAPWLAWAHASMRACGDDPAFAEAYARWTARQGELLLRCLDRQVLVPPPLGARDVVGGYVPYASTPGDAPYPDWRTAHLLILIAHGLRDPAIAAGHDTLGWLLSADLATGFLDRLVYTEASCYYHRSVGEALGGMRMSLVDNRVAPAPHALGLLAAAEFLDTLDALNRRRDEVLP